MALFTHPLNLHHAFPAADVDDEGDAAKVTDSPSFSGRNGSVHSEATIVRRFCERLHTVHRNVIHGNRKNYNLSKVHHGSSICLS